MSQNEIICHNCQNVNEPNSAFCANCGTKLTVVEETKPVEMTDLNNNQNEMKYERGLLAFSEGNFTEAVTTFTELGDYRDAAAKLELVKTTKAKHEEEIKQQEHALKEELFAAGIEAFSSGKLDQAEEAFSKLQDYPEAQEKLQLVKKAQSVAKESQNETYYHQGLELFSSGNLTKAAEVFTYLGSYRDSQDKLKMIQQNLATENQLNYQNQVTQLLQQGFETKESSVLGQIIGRLQEVGYNGPELAELEQKYHGLEQVKASHKEIRAKKVKLIVGVVLGVLVVFGIVAGVAYYRSNEAKQLAAAVEKQRSTNETSFSELDEGIQKELKEMLSSYGANTRDYTYKAVDETADYTMITYTFKGPDDSKDVLPASGTRLYNAVAFTRE